MPISPNWRPFALADSGVPADVVFAVLFGLVEFWRAGWDKTTNIYVIDIPCSFKRGTFVAERFSCSPG
jgi:hypothetical protein